MIRSKEDYKYYIECDRLSLGVKRKKPKLIGDLKNEIWKFERLLRKCEYYRNCKRNVLSRLIYLVLRYRFQQLSYRLRFEVPLNVCGPGLCLVHGGTIIINGNAKVGKNCRIHSGVNIGSIDSIPDKAPIIGDNVYIAPGVKIFGEVEVYDNCCIGANAVVNRTVAESGITLAGIPAEKKSDKNSDTMLTKGTCLYDE